MQISGDSISIWVNSSHRKDLVVTHKQFSPEWRKVFFLVVPEDQYQDYKQYEKEGIRLITMPKNIPSYLPSQRQWVIENAESDHVFIMDDDLQFYKRRDDLKLRVATTHDVEDMMTAVRIHLMDTNMVSISSRYQNNLYPTEYKENARCSRCYTVDRHIFLNKLHCTKCDSKGGFRYNPMEPFVHEDMWLVLHWFHNGYTNRQLYNYAQSDKGTNTKGGCSLYRTPDVQQESAFFVQEHFPDIIKVSRKITKGTWSGFDKNQAGENVRTDMTIQWAKAFKPRVKKEDAITRFFGKK